MQTTRETVVDYLLNGKNFELIQLIDRDPYAQFVFQEEKLYYLIDRYLDNDLSDQDRQAVEYLIDHNKEFKEEYELRRKLNNSVENLSLQIALDKAYETYNEQRWGLNDNLSKVVVPITRNKYIKWVAAASIIFILGFSILMAMNNRKMSGEELFAEYYSPLENIEGSGMVVNSTALKQAKQKYLNEDYQEAFAIFQNLPDTLSIHTEKNFFLALTMVELGMYDNAIKSFDSIIQRETLEYLPQAYWYLALCYLKTNQEDKAKEILENIFKDKRYNYTSAGKILKKL